MNGGTTEFIYDKSTPRSKRLENNVFVLYTPERIRLRPAEVKTIKMKVKIRLPKDLVGCCTLLKTFSDNEIKLLNSQYISSESNTDCLNQPVDLPWCLTIEVFNKNMSTVFQLSKKLEMEFFHILNDGGKEIRHVYEKEN